MITIIQRLHRTIANVDEIKQYLLDQKVSQNISVHIFEHLTLKRQVKFHPPPGPPCSKDENNGVHIRCNLYL